jgi:hypothetical protein
LDTQQADWRGDRIPWADLGDRFPLLSSKFASAVPQDFLYSVQLQPGDLLYIPHSWFHETSADTDTASLRVIPNGKPSSFYIPKDTRFARELAVSDVAEKVYKALVQMDCCSCTMFQALIPNIMSEMQARCLRKLVITSMYGPEVEECSPSDDDDDDDNNDDGRWEQRCSASALEGDCPACEGDAEDELEELVLDVVAWFQQFKESKSLQTFLFLLFAETILGEGDLKRKAVEAQGALAFGGNPKAIATPQELTECLLELERDDSVEHSSPLRDEI